MRILTDMSVAVMLALVPTNAPFAGMPAEPSACTSPAPPDPLV
jgi:hypothetical protein